MSQREWPCKKCTFIAPSRSAMRHHGYTTHDNEVVIPCGELEGESVTLKRVSGVFTCEVCGNSMKSSRSVLDFHTKCYFPDHPNLIPVATSTAGVDAAGEKRSTACTSASTVFIGPSESTTTASDLPQTSTEGVVEETPTRQAFDFLLKYGLEFREEYNLLVCRECKCAVAKSFADHTRRLHRVNIPSADADKIRNTCFKEESPYWKGGQPPLAALDFLPIHPGFKCATCNLYGKTERTIKEHAKATHGNENTVPCQVQNISTTFVKKFFGVLPTVLPESPVHSRQGGDSGEDCSAIALQTMRDVFAGAAAMPDESVKQVNLFYVTLGWYQEYDVFHSVDKQALLALPSEARDNNFENKENMLTIFADAIRSVSKHDYQLRFAVNCTGEEAGYKPRALCSFQNEATVNLHAATATKLMFLVYNISRTNLPVIPSLTTSVQQLVDDVFTKPTKHSLFALIRQLLADSTNTGNDSTDPIPLFVRFSCTLPRHGRLLPTEEISRLSARLLYLMKLSVLEGVMEQIQENRVQAMRELKPLVECSNLNNFSFMCRLKGLAKEVTDSTNRLPTVAKGASDTDITVRGIGITLDQLRRAYREVLNVCSNLVDTLLLGLDLSSVDFTNVYDNFANSSLGYQIMANKDPSTNEAIRSSLLKHVLIEDELKQRFVCAIREGKVVYRYTEATKYLAMYDEFVQHVIVLIHIGAGMPARGTELETYRLRNGPSTSRNVFYLCGQIFFHCEYSKTRAMTRTNKGVSRFMEMEASLLLLKDLLLIRPFVCSLASSVEKNDGQVYNYDLFVIDGCRLEAEGLRNIFSRLFYKLSGTAITFGLYRHVAKYFLNTFLRIFAQVDDGSDDPDEADDDDGQTYIGDLQFGHNSTTGNMIYGIHAGEMARMREHILQHFRELSGKWHGLLLSRKRKAAELPAPSAPSAPSTSSSSYSSLLPSVSASPAMRPSTASISSLATPPVCHAFVTVEQSSRSLELLRSLYNDDGAVFRSKEQQAAVDDTLHLNRDLFVVLPTGCGKTLLFFLYVCHNTNVTSPVIVPTVALQADLLRRAQGHGISCTDDPLHWNSERLVIVTPETVCTIGFREFLTKLQRANQLGKIFVDEAHCYSTEIDYRPCFGQLPTLGAYSVPLVLTTATAPEWIVSDILSNFFGSCRTPLLVRQDTNRLNISYSVQVNANVQTLTAECKRVVANLEEEERVVVYVTSIDVVRWVHQDFVKASIPCVTYTGQQIKEENETSFAAWRQGKASLMVATSSFGLGVDYSAIRYVYCYGLPYGMEEFSQQCGRAGRDGKPSSAILIVDPLREKFKLSRTEEGRRKKSMEYLLAFATESAVCRRRLISRYFDCTEIQCSYIPCEWCDVCRQQNRQSQGATPLPAEHNLGSGDESLIWQSAELFAAVDSHRSCTATGGMDSAHGQDLMSSQMHLGEQIAFFMRKYSSKCIVCHVAHGVIEEHVAGRNCPTMVGLCLRCFGEGHGYTNCRIRESRKIAGTYPCCFLPERIGDVKFHPNGFMNRCTHGEALKFFGLAAIKFGRIEGGKERWLYSRNIEGTLNLWIEFVNFCEEL